MGLASSSADLNVVGKACLGPGSAESRAVAEKQTYPHGGMKRPRDFIILFQPWAAAQDFWEPECANCTLHVANLALARCGCLDPLRGLSSYTTYHIGMGQCLGAPRALLDVECRWKRLGDPRMKRRGPAGDDETVIRLLPLVPRRRALPSARAEAQRRCHC